MITQDLDLEKSKIESPPIYSDGVIFKKRIRTKRKNCTWPITQKYRVKGKDYDNVSELEESYRTYGVIYSEPVQVVMVDPENKERFVGIAGSHRDKAQNNLGWEYAIYDVVEFETPLAQHTFGFTSNHHKPAQPLTKHDIHKGISSAIELGIISNDNKSIKDFIDKIAPAATQKKESLFDSYVKTHSKFENLEAFGAKEANNKAKELGLPYKGAENYTDTGEYGYIKEPGGYQTVLYGGLKLWLEHGEDIQLTGYITNPDPATLVRRRKTEQKEFSNMNELCYQIASKMTGMDIDEVKKLGRAPFKYNGFLPQVISADPGKGGLPVETELVDADGKPFKK